jgi:hypothetical protein
LRQICNVAVYIAHTACTVHLLNLPEKNARRDIIHGVKHLEEIAEGWLCARRTLGILSVLSQNWKVELPEEAVAVLARTEAKFGPYEDICSPKSVPKVPASVTLQDQPPQQQIAQQLQQNVPTALPAYSTPVQVAALANPSVLSSNAALPQTLPSCSPTHYAVSPKLRTPGFCATPPHP